MRTERKLRWGTRIGAIVFTVELLSLGIGTVMAQARGEQIQIIQLSRDHLVNHPVSAHSVVWNGPLFLDVGTPSGEFNRFEVANLTSQWTLLMDTQGRQLPVAARYDRQGLAVAWLPYDGPGRRSPAQSGSKLSDKEIAAALEKYSQTRMGGMMNAAKNFR